MIAIINQIFEIDQKLQAKAEPLADRNLSRIYHELELLGYQIINPINRRYRPTDTDVEANLIGELTQESQISRVLKPIIYKINAGGNTELLQKGIVIVEGI